MDNEIIVQQAATDYRNINDINNYPSHNGLTL